MLMALPKSTGLYELGLVLVMVREKGETPQQWLQRLDQGRAEVGRKLGGNNLSDGCYVELLLRGLLRREKGELIKAEVFEQAKDALEKDQPFACLVPISLVGRAPSNAQNKQRLQAAVKIVLLDPEMVWVVHKVPSMTSHQVQAREIHHMDIEPEGIIAKNPKWKVKEWPEHQLRYIRQHPAVYKGRIYRNEASGLYFYVEPSDRAPSTALSSFIKTCLGRLRRHPGVKLPRRK